MNCASAAPHVKPVCPACKGTGRRYVVDPCPACSGVKQRRCAGGFPSGYQCHNVAGCPHTPYWCFDCNEKRMGKISESLERMTGGTAR